MTLFIKETGEQKSLSLKVWDGKRWGDDFFHDVECNLVDGSEITAKQYVEVVDYWESEVADHNNGMDTEQFGDYNGTELGFFHN